MKKIIGWTLVLASGLAVLDQLTKAYAQNNFREPFLVIGEFFRFKYAENTGIAFSIPISQPFLIAIIIILFAVVYFMFLKEFDFEKKLSRIAFALIIGGGIGNLIDRLVHGFVIDFISIGNYPTFNFADIYITFGVLLVIFFYAKIKRT